VRFIAGRRVIIAIDGPAGVGKSTVAKALASRLQYRYLDTGALYRAVAWKIKKSAVDPADIDAVRSVLGGMDLKVELGSTASRIYVDGREVTTEIRTPEISRLASVVSTIPALREWLLPIQRRYGLDSVVVEGRDIGTCVFPLADVKFFLDAQADVRAARRHKELEAAGEAGSLDSTLRELDSRDSRDRARATAPLQIAPDACVIDTTGLGVEHVVERMLAYLAPKL
jgi:cytidylate kinase